MRDGLIKRLMSSIKCSSCGQHHESNDVDVLGHNEDVWFLQVRCSSCHTHSLVAAIIKEARTINAAGDLAAADEVRRPCPVSADDVLDMHGFLNGFDGDFSHLFERGQSAE